MSGIESLSDVPRYNIKAVCAQTGIMAVTLRAWERRYSILTPHRTRSNYRLYSERDVAILRWLKTRVDSGAAIRSAAAEWLELRSRGLWPEPPPALHLAEPVAPSTPPGLFAERLFPALLRQDEAEAGAILAEGHALFDLVTVCTAIITPCLVRVGEAWHQGEILISTEHRITQYLRGRLMTLFQSFPGRRGAPHIIMACTPSELHEIGSLMLATLLRRDGYRVEYLGTGLPASDLLEYVVSERPALVGLTASSVEAARELPKIRQGIVSALPATHVSYGGRIFVLQPELRQEIGGLFLGETVRDAQANIRELLGNF